MHRSHAPRKVKPVYLLADSQLLFWQGRAGPFLSSILKDCGISTPRIAYIGASNGDSAEAHSIFMAAVGQLETVTAHHVRVSYAGADREFLETTDVIVLAGGDVEKGWNAFTQTGMRDTIRNRFEGGAVIIGVSAGEVQCGSHAVLPGEQSTSRLIETFGFAPYVVDAHDEKADWQWLSSAVHLLEGGVIGLGIPCGGGLATHPDGTLEPIRKAVDCFIVRQGNLMREVLMAEKVESGGS
jgi:cyanophycinase-like exopeptidase